MPVPSVSVNCTDISCVFVIVEDNNDFQKHVKADSLSFSVEAKLSIVGKTL